MNLLSIVLLALGLVLGYFLRQFVLKRRASSIEVRLRKKIEETRKQAQEIILEAKNQASKTIDEARTEAKERERQLMRLEERLMKREENLEIREKDIQDKQQKLNETAEKLKRLNEELAKGKEKLTDELSRIAHLTRDEAKKELFAQIEKEAADELIALERKTAEQRRQVIEEKTRDIILSVIERFSRSVASETTSSIVNIGDDELKGKIIGKEGRNIRHLEKLTGVEIIIDETPGIVTLSSFDPTRRAIAKLAVEKLIKDGRIQPAKIEEKVDEAKKEIHEQIVKAGEAAVYEVGIFDFPPQIIQLMGRLQFRTSYGQNVLQHSVEVALLAGMLAKELGLDVDIAKKGGLLHDVGKSVDQEIEGSHLEIGRKILQKYGIDEKVVKAMQSHHETYPIEIPEASLVNAADIISASRIGARSDSLENYIKRLSDLEEIATTFPGVEKAYAISGGREIRVFVFPQEISDLEAIELAKNVAQKIESELKYPGEIKVNVIRETRATEYAK